MARGGRRQPRNPAPVSGPGALSERTDGGPGNSRQPIRVATGQPYGQAGALAAQQRAAPLPVAPGLPAPGPATPRPVAPLPSPFGPTERPNEPIDTGLRSSGQTLLGDDPDLVLRALYNLYPHPDIARLIQLS